ncbi:Fur family transcriptional regulator [Halalkalibacter oceani]
MEKQTELALAKLKANGIRITPQRLAIYRNLLKKEHPTANELYQSVKVDFPSVSYATVYNTLRSLKKKGIIKELNFGETIHYDAVTDHHYHVICTTCGKVVDLHYPYLEEIDQYAAKRTKYKITHHHLVF